jgi:hypothetical protein
MQIVNTVFKCCVLVVVRAAGVVHLLASRCGGGLLPTHVWN